MKKANSIFALIIAFAVFTLSFSQFNSEYANKVKDFSEFKKDSKTFTRLFVILDMSNNNEGVETLFTRVNEIVSNNNYDMFIYEIINSSTGATNNNYYIRFNSSSEYFKSIYLRENNDKNENSPLFVTNNLERSSKLYVDYLDSDYYSFTSNYYLNLENAEPNTEINAFNFEAMPVYASDNATYYRLFIDVPKQELDNVKRELQNGLWMYSDVKVYFNEKDILSIHELDANVINSDIENTSSKIILDHFTFVSIMIIAVLIAYHYFENRKKEIAVRLILGKSRISILFQIYIQYLTNFVVFYSLGFLVSWTLYIRSLRPIAIDFTSSLMKQAFLVLIVVFVTSFIFAILTTYLTDYSNIKRTKKSIFPLIIITLIRISVSSLLIASIMTNSVSFINDFSNYKNIKNNKELTRRYVLGYYDKFVSNLSSNNDDLNKELERKIFNIFEKYNGEYLNSTIYDKGIDSYEAYLKSNPGMPKDRLDRFLEDVLYPLPSEIPTLFVNYSYLKNFNFTDLNDQTIDISETSSMVLIPNTFKGSFNYEEIMGYEEVAINLYKNNSIHFTNISKVVSRYKNPIIILLPNSVYINNENSLIKNNNFNSWFVSNDVISNERFNDELKLHGINGSTQMESYSQAEILISDSMQRSAMEYGQRLAITLLYILMYIFTICTVFVDYKRKRLTIEYMMGKTKFERYQDVLLIVLVSGVISIYYFKFNGYELFIAYLISFIELIVSMIYMIHLERKHAMQLIKGGNL